ncbi:MAG: alpha/beta hydrolase [Alphaproteobacteria bacterium]|nr:alpha/beta hydrolase [Alphaproteobacteria bacterium]
MYKDLHFEYIKGAKKSNVKFVLLHGWGHSLENLRPIANELSDYDCYLIDLPGFGESPQPESVLSVSNYTDIIAYFIKTQFSKKDKVYIIGHSFGGRIGVYIGANYPDLISGAFILAGAGLKKHKKLFRQLIITGARGLKIIYKVIGKDVMTSALYRKYYERFASRDYKNAQPLMREILKKTVMENLAPIARKVSVPTVLIYGENDTVTPVYFGKKYHKLIKDSKFYILPTFDHNGILTAGKYQVTSIILNNIKE